MRQAKFSALSEAGLEFARRVIVDLPESTDTILDLGCGIGDLTIALKDLIPATKVSGIDFSKSNIDAAQARSNEIHFEFANYMEWAGGRFSVIVADSVLHLIEAPIDQIAGKLASDLLPGGRLIATVPDNGFGNHALLFARRLYRLLPKATDTLLLSLAMHMYPTISREALGERILYMRILPRLFGPAEQTAFLASGLHLHSTSPWPSTSLAKPRHRLMVWARAST